MGLIADDLDIKSIPLHALLTNPANIVVLATGLSTSAGPVFGTVHVQDAALVTKFLELSKAFKLVSAAVKKLEDKIKVLENTNPATGRALPPVGFRK